MPRGHAPVCGPSSSILVANQANSFEATTPNHTQNLIFIDQTSDLQTSISNSTLSTLSHLMDIITVSTILLCKCHRSRRYVEYYIIIFAIFSNYDYLTNRH